MSDQEKDVKTEATKEEAPKAEPKKEDIYADIFVDETDTFDVSVRYYKTSDGIILVDNLDDDFDKKLASKEFTVTFKYPNQADVGRISTQASKITANIEDLDVRDFLSLEFARLICLIRGWGIEREISNQNIMQLHPKIVKGIIVNV